MKAKTVMDHIRQLGAAIDPELCDPDDGTYRVDPVWPAPDRFIFGDPEIEVTGIAVAWMATNKVLRQVAGRGHNLFVVHEPGFYQGGGYEDMPLIKQMTRQKMDLLDKLGLTLIRFHAWDRTPDVGILDTWADLFGFETEPRDLLSYHKICLVGDMTVEQLSRHVLGKVRPYGQDTVMIWGDEKKRVSRMGVGTGAVTQFPPMYELGADVCLATDDGYRFYAPQASLDMDVPALVVNHATAELPGMESMARHFRQVFGEVPVEYFDVEFPYRSIH